ARALEMIEQDARALERIVGDILDVSRIITGKLGLQVESVDLAPTIEAAIEAVRPAADAKSIQIESVLDDPVTPISGDEARLRQIVWNLLSNAIKFTPKGGRIEVRLERADSSAQITVKDTGRGIAPDFLPHVFERFRQADSSTTRAQGGLGLGLAIVRHLVDLHGGVVNAESEGHDRGTRFMVMLPAAAPKNVGAIDHGVGGGAASSAMLSGLRVLDVDDDADARELTVVVLQGAGAEVAAVASAPAALTTLDRFQPHVVLADIAMPLMDGYELLRAIRERGGDDGPPVIALTAYAD